MVDKNLAVYVMTHGPECICLEDYCYPLEVGAAYHDIPSCILRDNTGDNISDKDKLYCELTGLYWIWKNKQHDYIGLYHYRRLFDLSSEKIINYLSEYDIILPKMIRIIPNIDMEYDRQKLAFDWKILKDVLNELYPEYYESAKLIFPSKKSYAYNMFITNDLIFKDYCNWLFPLLQEVERRLKASPEREIQYNIECNKPQYLKGYYERAIGFLSERMIHVYVFHKGLRVKEVPIYRVAQYSEISPRFPRFIREFTKSNLNLRRIVLKFEDLISNVITKFTH